MSKQEFTHGSYAFYDDGSVEDSTQRGEVWPSTVWRWNPEERRIEYTYNDQSKRPWTPWSDRSVDRSYEAQLARLVVS